MIGRRGFHFLFVSLFAGVCVLSGEGSSLPATPKLSWAPYLPGLVQWEGDVDVQPYKAYRLSWSTDLVDWRSGSIKWDRLADKVSSIFPLPRDRAAFLKIDCFDAFAPDVLPQSIVEAWVREVDEANFELVRLEENSYRGWFKEIEDGIELNIYFSFLYQRIDPNNATVTLDFGQIAIKDIASGDPVVMSIQELVAELGEVFPVAAKGEMVFSGVEEGTIRTVTIGSDQSEQDLGTEVFGPFKG